MGRRITVRVERYGRSGKGREIMKRLKVAAPSIPPFSNIQLTVLYSTAAGLLPKISRFSFY